MPTPAYKHASLKGGTLLLLILAGIVGQVGVFFILPVLGWHNPGFWVLPLSCSPLLIAVFWGLRIFRRYQRERFASLGQRLTSHGFTFESGDDRTRKEAFCAPIAHLFPGIGRHGLLGTRNAAPATDINWFAVKPGHLPTLLFEHEFTIGTSKQSETIIHTILAWPAGHPDLRDRDLAGCQWSVVSRFPKILADVAASGGNADTAFAALYDKGRIAHEPATAKRFLTAGVIAELQKSPMPESWYLGYGWVLCAFGAALDADNLDPFLNHARSVAMATG